MKQLGKNAVMVVSGIVLVGIGTPILLFLGAIFAKSVWELADWIGLVDWLIGHGL